MIRIRNSDGRIRIMFARRQTLRYLDAMKRSHIIIAIIVILALQVLVLYMLDHPFSCRCGNVKIWDGAVSGPENSQHIFDWYTFSHITYGFILYFFAWLLRKKFGWTIGTTFLLALLFSAGWEIFENTHYVVSHFQQNTISSEYYGDSIVNSLIDNASVALGFWLAYYIPVSVVIILIIAMEIVAGSAIRDNLFLSAIMFVHPFPALLKWQGG